MRVSLASNQLELLRLRSHLAISVENFTKCRRSLCKVYRILQCFGPSPHNNKSFHWLIFCLLPMGWFVIAEKETKILQNLANFVQDFNWSHQVRPMPDFIICNIALGSNNRQESLFHIPSFPPSPLSLPDSWPDLLSSIWFHVSLKQYVYFIPQRWWCTFWASTPSR